MADTKISALGTLAGASAAAGDLFPVVDVSDTSMAGTGTDKSITRDEMIVALAKAPTRQVLTVGSGTYTTPANCVAIDVEMVGGGAGGGGAAQSAASAAAGSGGGAGGYLRKLISAPSATYSYTTGAKGTGGAAGNNPGNAGADSTFGTSLLTTKGGTGGQGQAAAATPATNRGGIATAVSTGGDINTIGGGGGVGIRLSGTVVSSGWGADSFFGSGGRARDSTESAGDAASAYGAGGGGGSCVGTTARAGGDGQDGIIIVTEYY